MSGRRLRTVAGALAPLLRSELSHAVGRGSEEDMPATRRRARETRLVFERLGPFYIKVGQILSTRPDIVSEEMVREFRGLHDTVSVQPFPQFESVLRAELGDRWRTMFATFDTTHPLGAASLAQVYAATLPDGRPTAVKVQRPGVAPVIGQDMALLRRAAGLLARVAPGFTELVDVRAMLGTLFEAMNGELDFTLEAQQMDRARAEIVDFKHLDVPEVLLATPRVMIQSRAPGCSIRDADPTDFTTDERLGIGRDLLAFMYRGYFTTKVFHADPHPGNIFVHPGHKASLIDWGMVGRIDRRTSHTILRVLANVVLNDGQGVARAWIDMGRATDRADIPAFTSDMEALVPTLTSVSLDQLDFGITFTALLTASTRRGIRTNPAIAMLGKSFANLEGSIRHLVPELRITDIFADEIRDIMIDLIADEFSELRLADTILTLTTSDSTLQHLQTILQNLATGEMTVRAQQASRLDPRTRTRRVVFGVAAAAYLWAKDHRTARILAQALTNNR